MSYESAREVKRVADRERKRVEELKTPDRIGGKWTSWRAIFPENSSFSRKISRLPVLCFNFCELSRGEIRKRCSIELNLTFYGSLGFGYIWKRRKGLRKGHGFGLKLR
jgi:hypothetical protein